MMEEKGLWVDLCEWVGVASAVQHGHRWRAYPFSTIWAVLLELQGPVSA